MAFSMCCTGGQRRQQKNKTQKANAQPLPAQQKGVALKIATQAAAQIAAQMAKKNPYLLQNRMM